MSARPLRTIYLLRRPDGTLWDMGRNGHGRHRGEGPTVVYQGEALAVMNLVLGHTSGSNSAGNGKALEPNSE